MTIQVLTPEKKTVRAIKAGFYEQYRQAGDEFQVAKHLTASWFEPVNPEVDTPKEVVESIKTEPVTQEETKTVDEDAPDTVDELKAKLDELGIPYSPNARKSTLEKLLAEHTA